MSKFLKVVRNLIYRPIIIYILIIWISAKMINFELISQQHSTYLGWLFSSSNMKNMHDGIRYYDYVLSRDRKNAPLWNALGVCYFKIGRAEKAEVCFKKAVDLDSQSIPYQKNLKAIKRLQLN